MARHTVSSSCDRASGIAFGELCACEDRHPCGNRTDGHRHFSSLSFGGATSGLSRSVCRSLGRMSCPASSCKESSFTTGWNRKSLRLTWPRLQRCLPRPTYLAMIISMCFTYLHQLGHDALRATLRRPIEQNGDNHNAVIRRHSKRGAIGPWLQHNAELRTLDRFP